MKSNSSIKENPNLLYVGVDGVMTPLNQAQGYKEAKVGVIFWSKDHQKVKGKRGVMFPDSIEILDFFHLCEYVWAVAKAAYPKQEQQQKDWVKTQQQLLKISQWKTVIQNSQILKRKKPDLIKAITDLERYLTNNQSRIDYQSYLRAGLMIGSGVVESSNRRIVTQRLKQAGMHWSKLGAEGVMALRAAYLSNSTRWSSFWSERSRIKSKLA